MSKQVVYIPMCADIVHTGHLKVIKKGSSLGSVTIGLLTDEAVTKKKRLPFMNYEQRYAVISNIRGVDNVIPQDSSDYRPNLKKLKPAYVVHGDDWAESAKKQVVETLAEWGGELIEIEYTDGISSTLLHKKLKTNGISPQERQRTLNRLIDSGKTIRVLEAHNGLSALIVENTKAMSNQGRVKQFDAIWISSLTDSISRGKPDNELVDRSARLATINEIIEVTTKPIIVDGDTGGHTEHFVHTVRTLERLGVSAVVIEDKTGLKQNSLHENISDHTQEDIEVFSDKIKKGLLARVHETFMIIARIESLIIGKGETDALKRAQAYIDAGAGVIMIHSKDPTGKDVKSFTEKYNKFENRKPLLLVPTSYDTINEVELEAWGANIIVYANQLLRAAYPAMERAAVTILQDSKASSTSEFSSSIEDFLKMIPGS